MNEASGRSHRVHKFGGTSVADAARVHAAVALALDDARAHPDAQITIVTSALGGVTDRLLAAISSATARDGHHGSILSEIGDRYRDVLREVAKEEEREGLEEDQVRIVGEIEELLQGMYLLRECTPRFSDAVISAGERLAAPLVAAAVRSAGRDALAIDAREIVFTDDAFGEAAVDMSATTDRIRERFEEIPQSTVVVVTGFIAATHDSVTTTLGRSGSDYTATLLAAALEAEAAIIWTDVDGVLSADPRLVPEAFSLPELTYREAAELAHFGAKVLHPRTMRPLERAGIPLWIKNTLRPEASSTRITAELSDDGAPIKSITAVRDVALIVLEGAGLIGVPDLTATAFSALAARELPVLLIAQASSEGSLCFAVRERDRDEAVNLLRRAFARETERGDIHGIESEGGLAVIAAVGQGVSGVTGLAGRMFSTLGRAHVNVRAIAEGASDHNLSCVIADREAARAVSALHEAFAMRRLRAHLALVGAGTMGRDVIEMLNQRAGALLADHGIHLRLVALADSRRLVWDVGGIEFDSAKDVLSHAEEHGDVLDALTNRVHDARLERVIIIDVSGSEQAARLYPRWLGEGAAIVTPNQLPFTLEPSLAEDIRRAAREKEVPLLYETTVGAGLSVLSTLRDLVRTGDNIRRIHGVFSGTLSFVFAALRDGSSFSEAVRQAAEAGLTERDPRADLAGEDIARKLVILARELGMSVTRAEAQVQSLVPEDLVDLPLDEFWQRLPSLDAAWRQRSEEYASQGQSLQYVAVVAPGMVRAGVQALQSRSAMAAVPPASVLFSFHTERYDPHPLVVRGPGANRAVTTAVLLADIVRAAEAMR